ncbi:MAG: sigma-70 family RNA polymerase sigma factor [Calditrichaeota bacterium]|nr:sigma-70 family RNA polymerase sigma factor [Calditrichota bacterium]
MTRKVQTPTAVDFETLYRDYGRSVLNLVYRMTGDEEVARDLTQDIFYKIYTRLDEFEGRSRIYTWIYRIAVNHVLNYLKRERRRKWVELLEKRTSEIFQEASERVEWKVPPESPDARMERHQREAIIWQMIQQLPDKLKLPFVLHRYEQMSYKEIAEILELSVSAVEARIYRAGKQLVKKLEPWLGKI